MKRFYLVGLEGMDSMSVKFTFNHELIAIVLRYSSPEDMKTLKSLYKMTEEEYIGFLRKVLGDRPVRQYRDVMAVFDKSHKEEWYVGAWSFVTKRIEKKLKLSEAPDMDLDSFFDKWMAIIESEKKAIAEQKRKELAEKNSHKRLVRKPVEKRKVKAEEDNDNISIDDMMMVDSMLESLNVTKRRLVKRT